MVISVSGFHVRNRTRTSGGGAYRARRCVLLWAKDQPNKPAPQILVLKPLCIAVPGAVFNLKKESMALPYAHINGKRRAAERCKYRTPRIPSTRGILSLRLKRRVTTVKDVLDASF
jgi:hypothetical protein